MKQFRYSLIERLMLVAILAIAAALFVPSLAQAQSQRNESTYIFMFTNAASTAPVLNKVIHPEKQKDVALQIEVNNDAATSTTFTLPYQRSVDGTNYESALSVVSFTVASVSKTTFVTNLTTWGAGWIKFPWCTNASATVNATNVTLRWASRTGQP